ncbi:hypothetical protein MKW94_011355 [Papaver nudicaule]|uniref:Uncharacterized protein n=1 Tax=Papaver nudicaule TaxID=74823 RepID=A0AA41S183_PAPNU|nr:hypothetical protein [Papaver nudicaule]
MVTSFGKTSAFKTSFANRNKKHLTNEQWMTIFHFLLKESKREKIQRGLEPKATQQFSVSQATVKQLTSKCVSRKPTRVGLKAKEFDWSKIPEIPLRRRTNIRSLAKALNILKSTVHRQIKKGKIKKHTNAIKPAFTTEIKKVRLEFCLGMIKENMMFEGMYNVIHTDEKWFYMTKTTENYYLHPEEEEPH